MRIALAWLLLVTMAASLAPLSVLAQPAPDLYRAETIVTGTEEPERTRGLRIALTDVDRAPWLDAVGRAMRDATRAGTTPVMACSALKRAYRERILAEEPEAFFVLLDVDRAELQRRLKARKHHYMPASLLDSQLATLERLVPGEPGVIVPIAGPAGDVEDTVLAKVLQAR